MKAAKIKENPDNPRWISAEKLEQLSKSIKEFEQMMESRPIVIDEDNVILGGNMRYRACVELGYTDIPDKWVRQVKGWTEEEKQEFVVKDNSHFGEWDNEKIQSFGTKEQLEGFGLDVEMMFFREGLLEETDDPDAPAVERFKTIQVEFEKDDYPIAKRNYDKVRESGLDVGHAMLVYFRQKKKSDV
jgi:hypothetical protein